MWQKGRLCKKDINKWLLPITGYSQYTPLPHVQNIPHSSTPTTNIISPIKLSLIFFQINAVRQKYFLPAPNSHSSLYAPHALLVFYLPVAVIYIKILTPIMSKISLRTGFLVLFIRLFLQNSLSIILVSGSWDNFFFGIY